MKALKFLELRMRKDGLENLTLLILKASETRETMRNLSNELKMAEK